MDIVVWFDLRHNRNEYLSDKQDFQAGTERGQVQSQQMELWSYIKRKQQEKAME